MSNTPKLGDHVLFFRNAQHEPLTATVCKVHPLPDPNLPKDVGPPQLGIKRTQKGVLVNLFVLTEDGLSFNKVKVPVVTSQERPEEGGFCEYAVTPPASPASTAP